MQTPFQPASAEAVELRSLAAAVSERAYVPYSQFRVGAVLRSASGATITGCNVENASYGLTVCAERAAVARAVAEGFDLASVDLVVVHVDGASGEPCGMCRQVLLELVPQARVAFVHGGVLVECDVRELIPGGFEPGALDQ